MKEPKIRRAITTQTITGACIETIPTGTEFDIIIWDDDSLTDKEYPKPYCPCNTKGLGITAIWNDEFKFIN